ncbi:hypothetical protein [Synechococcus sp. PCC 7336]|uniref:hypothetical protein n=1 Tax=Synechococcus sp. PCC 7336 TaxID=195250 RepID=UPI0003460575|nr:hypothetical protein [Synechococcus sp. PCC 7336]
MADNLEPVTRLSSIRSSAFDTREDARDTSEYIGDSENTTLAGEEDIASDPLFSEEPIDDPLFDETAIDHTQTEGGPVDTAIPSDSSLGSEGVGMETQAEADASIDPVSPFNPDLVFEKPVFTSDTTTETSDIEGNQALLTADVNTLGPYGVSTIDGSAFAIEGHLSTAALEIVNVADTLPTGL